MFFSKKNGSVWMKGRERKGGDSRYNKNVSFLTAE